MPRGDRTGPMGFGPMTGRAAGFCAGYGMPGYMNPIPGRGWGRGYGFHGGGRGWRHRFYATGLPGWARAGWDWPHWGFQPYAPAPPYSAANAPAEELGTLKAQAEYYNEALEEIKKRIEELEKEKES